MRQAVRNGMGRLAGTGRQEPSRKRQSVKFTREDHWPVAGDGLERSLWQVEWARVMEHSSKEKQNFHNNGYGNNKIAQSVFF